MTDTDRQAPATIGVLIEHPLLVIGVPCFNEGEYLERTLTSIERQTWPDFAVLISDNASTDATGAIAQAYCERDSRFRYYRQPANIGSCGNFNFITDHSASRYILWLGAHDLITSNMIERHIRVLEARAEVSVSESAHSWVDIDDRFVERVEDGRLDDGEADDPERYIRSIGQNRNNIGANSVIRRAMLDDTRFTNVVGTDRILLSHLAFRGPFATTDDVLYMRRTFAARAIANNYMERLTGDARASEDWTAFAAEYDRQFAALLGERADARRLRRRLNLTLRYHLPVGRGSLLTGTLWTIRRLRKRIDRLLRR